MKTMSILQGVAAASLWMLSACAPTSQDDPAQQVGTARLTVVDDAHAAGSARVVAREAATGALVQETALQLDGKTSIDLTLPPGNYLFEVRAFADQASSSLLCVGSAKVVVAALAMATVDIQVVARAGGKVDLGISGSGVSGAAGGGATVGTGATADAGAAAGGGARGGRGGWRGEGGWGRGWWRAPRGRLGRGGGERAGHRRLRRPVRGREGE